MTLDARQQALRDAANRSFVGAVQRLLLDRGYAIGTDDEWAGGKTVAALGLELGADLTRRPAPPAAPGLVDFRGDLDRVHAWEAHAGRPYWPEGRSGVTLDPGFDLGQNDAAELRRQYGEILEEDELRALESVIGLRGEAAGRAVAKVRHIRISREEAARAMPAIAAGYWRAIASRFPSLLRADVPPAIHTAALSLAYNRGAFNDELEPLGAPLAAGDWWLVADLIGRMQQDHEQGGIRRRRREEAKLIVAELDRLEAEARA